MSDLYAYVAHVTRLVLDLTRPEEHRPIPVCILGVLEEDGVIEGNRYIYNETVMCPKGVKRRVRDALLFRCECGSFHGVVPNWVIETLRDIPGPGLRIVTKWTHPTT